MNGRFIVRYAQKMKIKTRQKPLLTAGVIYWIIKISNQQMDFQEMLRSALYSLVERPSKSFLG